MGAVVDVLITSASRWSVKGRVIEWVFPRHLQPQLRDGHLQSMDQSGSHASSSMHLDPPVSSSPSAAGSSTAGDSYASMVSCESACPSPVPEAASLDSPHRGERANASSHALSSVAAVDEASIAAVLRKADEAESSLLPCTQDATGLSDGRSESPEALAPAAADAGQQAVAITTLPVRKQQLDLVDYLLYSGVILGLAGVLLNALWTLIGS